ncbi:unnamed protein product [Acanthoscelides obtectus]|uniref:SAP domain-containing protein n=1 Tax=Acanthoscelides obtectus TaxID=200917 RepID=A0A9P0KP53_ACAOB|nr:unnamed protein product [Acanthoscelides obtectus]CAK1623705.1 hypothetical protein AOBTE_LOCUS2133 [Acanthoscelides obtectus]
MVRLVDLKIADLERELEERECDMAGKKAEVQERLRKSSIEEDEDSDNFIFTGAVDIGLMLQNLSTKLEKREVLLAEDLRKLAIPMLASGLDNLAGKSSEACLRKYAKKDNESFSQSSERVFQHWQKVCIAFCHAQPSIYKDALLPSLSDSGRILSSLFHDSTMARRMFTYPYMNQSIRELLENPSSTNLSFGLDLSDVVKAAKSIRSTSKDTQPSLHPQIRDLLCL